MTVLLDERQALTIDRVRYLVSDLTLPPDEGAHAMAPHQVGRARPSLFFVFDLRDSCDADAVIMDKLSSVAAGEQTSESHHADGYIFTGPALASRHRGAVRQAVTSQNTVACGDMATQDMRSYSQRRYDRIRRTSNAHLW